MPKFQSDVQALESLIKHNPESKFVSKTYWWRAIRECYKGGHENTFTRIEVEKGLIECRFIDDGLYVRFKIRDAISAARRGELKKFLETEIAIAKMRG